MEEMIKVSSLCIAVCLITTVTGQGSRTMASLLMIASGTVLFAFTVKKGAAVWQQIKIIISASGIEGKLIMPMIKVLGISLCARISGELCRDMGSKWAASNIEIFAVISSVICMLPLLEEVLRLVGSL